MAEDTTKTTEKTTEKTTTKAFDAKAFDKVVEQYRTAPGPEARAKIIAEHPDLTRDGIMLARKFEREHMPLYAQVLGRLEENAVYDKVRVVRDGILTGVAGWVAWKGIKFAWTWFKGP